MSKDDRKRYLILKDSNIIKGLLLLSIPLMLNNFVRVFHDLVDMYFVSKIPNYAAESISAIGITFPITFMYISFGIGLSVAGTALISQYYGSGQFETARKYATHLVIIALLVGLFFNILSFFAAPSIVKLMGATGYTLENSSSYLMIRSFELPFVFLFFAFTAMRQSSGDTVTPVILGVIALILNMFLSPYMISDQISIFGSNIEVFNLSFYIKEFTINGLGLGVDGAAYATLISNVIIVPFIIIFMFKSKTGITLDLKYTKLQKSISKPIIFTAIPAATGQAITAVGFAVLNGFILTYYGEVTVSAFNVGNRVANLILMPVMAIGGIMSAYIGQNIGNLNPKRAKKAYLQGMLMSIVIMIFGSIIGLIFRAPAASLFLTENEFALDLAITYTLFLFLGLPLMAIFQAHIGAFNGSGRTKYTFFIGIIRLWGFRIPLIMIFKYFTDFGSSGIWYAMMLSNMLIVIVGFFFMKKIDFSPKIKIEATVS